MFPVKTGRWAGTWNRNGQRAQQGGLFGKVPRKVSVVQSHRRALETMSFPHQTYPSGVRLSEHLYSCTHPDWVRVACAGKAGSGTLNSRSALRKEMQVPADESESSPENSVPQNGKGFAEMYVGHWHGQPHLCQKVSGSSPGLDCITSLLSSSLRFWAPPGGQSLS